jgi:predicted nucleic-acid-binding Zn-ribbon protein
LSEAKKCPKCGSTDLKLKTKGAIYTGIFSTGVIVYVFVCSNCGYVELYHAKTLENKEG